MVDTPLVISMGLPQSMFDAAKAQCSAYYPSRRIGAVQDTTNVITFLASSKADFLTGLKVPVDGGFLCTSASSASQALQKKAGD